MMTIKSLAKKCLDSLAELTYKRSSAPRFKTGCGKTVIRPGRGRGLYAPCSGVVKRSTDRATYVIASIFGEIKTC